MNIDKTAMLTGWLMGRKVAAMMTKPEPVKAETYSYNGVILPALPERNTTKYPYVVIRRDNMIVAPKDYLFEAYFLTEPCTFKEGTLFKPCTLQFTSYGDYMKMSIDLGKGEASWSNLVEYTNVSEVSIGAGLNQQKYFVWSNYTIVNVADDEVILERSEQAIPGEAIGYRYNEYSAPKLPEWDKTVYPYATICANGSVLRLILLPEPYVYDAETDTITIPTARGKIYLVTGGYTSEWVLNSESGSAEDFRLVVWTSYDVMSTDGTVYFAGSEPLPAYDK